MHRFFAFCAIFAALLFSYPAITFAETMAMDGGKSFSKLTRGAINTVTGWVEVPKRIQETTEASGPWSGFTWGLCRGLGYGFARTAAGLYELVTFPFPVPLEYAPVIEPEYVFSEEPAVANSNNP